jgi:hypothetical protein
MEHIDDLQEWVSQQYSLKPTFHTKTQQAVIAYKLNPNTVKTVVRNQQFIIGSLNKTTGAFSISESPVVHPNAVEADKEAKRLASLDSNKIFVVLKVTNGFQNVVVQNVETLH